MSKKEYPEILFEALRLGFQLSKCDLPPGTRIEIKGSIHDEKNKAIVTQTRKKPGVPDEKILRIIYECLSKDLFIDHETGRIKIDPMAGYCAEQLEPGAHGDKKRNYTRRIKKLLPYFKKVIGYNGFYYYKGSKYYNPPPGE